MFANQLAKAIVTTVLTIEYLTNETKGDSVGLFVIRQQ